MNSDFLNPHQLRYEVSLEEAAAVWALASVVLGGDRFSWKLNMYLTWTVTLKSQPKSGSLS